MAFLVVLEALIRCVTLVYLLLYGMLRSVVMSPYKYFLSSITNVWFKPVSLDKPSYPKNSRMSQTDQSIESLCEAISHNTHKVAEYLRSKSLPFPSFDVEAPRESMIPLEAVEIQQARADVINDTRKLRNLMLGPRDYLMSFTVQTPFLQHISN